MFVTGLEFLPVSENHTVTSVAEAAVLSISVDNHVCIHTLPYRREYVLFFVVLFVHFYLCFRNYAGLRRDFDIGFNFIFNVCVLFLHRSMIIINR